jgi:hypothetical protein
VAYSRAGDRGRYWMAGLPRFALVQLEGGEDVPVVALRPVQDSDLDSRFDQMRDPASALMAW